MKHLLVVIALPLSVLACGHGATPATAEKSTPAGRQFVQLSAETLWSRGGQGDRVLRYPQYMAHDTSTIYVSDLASEQIVAFGSNDGRLLWRSSAIEVRKPSSITPVHGGGVAALTTLGVVSLDAGGRVTRTVALEDPASARQICAFRDGRVLIAYNRKRFPLVVIDTMKQVTKRFDLPWTELRSLEPMQTQVALAGDGGDVCIAALYFGRGFAALTADSIRYTVPYVQSVELPTLKTVTHHFTDSSLAETHIEARHPAVRDLNLDNGVLQVVFEGLESQGRTLIDEYDATSGRYLQTRTSPRHLVALQKSRERIMTLALRNGYPALTAILLKSRNASASTVKSR